MCLQGTTVGQSVADRAAEAGFRVTEERTAAGERMIRLRGSHEDLMRLAYPDRVDDKPPLPSDLNIEKLPRYSCGCPHCGKTSLAGEGQWRYQELSRTRGCRDNTTTYLVKCKNCNGFMTCMVDHDD